MKKLCAAGLVAILTGCQGFASFRFGPSLHFGVVTVVNATDYNLEVLSDGESVVKLEPGEYWPVKIYAPIQYSQYAQYSRQVSLTVLARDPSGKLAGTTSTTYHTGFGFGGSSWTWTIDKLNWKD